MLFGAEVAKFPMFYIPTPAHVFFESNDIPTVCFGCFRKKDDEKRGAECMK
jgi:hypothetical protein